MKHLSATATVISTLAAGMTASTLLWPVAAPANQVNMEAALARLNEAKASLESAKKDKGGHRAKALSLVDAAIREVQAGISFDRNNRSPKEERRQNESP